MSWVDIVGRIAQPHPESLDGDEAVAVPGGDCRHHARHIFSPHGDQQTLNEAVALARAGDREALRDHLRSYGCGLYFPRERLRDFPPERSERRERC